MDLGFLNGVCFGGLYLYFYRVFFKSKKKREDCLCKLEVGISYLSYLV